MSPGLHCSRSPVEAVAQLRSAEHDGSSQRAASPSQCRKLEMTCMLLSHYIHAHIEEHTPTVTPNLLNRSSGTSKIKHSGRQKEKPEGYSYTQVKNKRLFDVSVKKK